MQQALAQLVERHIAAQIAERRGRRGEDRRHDNVEAGDPGVVGGRRFDEAFLHAFDVFRFELRRILRHAEREGLDHGLVRRLARQQGVQHERKKDLGTADRDVPAVHVFLDPLGTGARVGIRRIEGRCRMDSLDVPADHGGVIHHPAVVA